VSDVYNMVVSISFVLLVPLREAFFSTSRSSQEERFVLQSFLDSLAIIC